MVGTVPVERLPLPFPTHNVVSGAGDGSALQGMFGSNSGGAIMARIILPFLRIVKLTRLTTLGTIAAAMNLGSSNFVDHALAQSSYCVSLTNAYSRALQEANSKDVIRTARELLQFCQRELIATNDYGGTLAILASALSRDGQPNEAVLVAERCLQLKTDSHLECLYAKGEAYFGLHRYEDARRALNQAINEPALTDVDEKAKQAARRILLQLPPARAETPKIAPKVRERDSALAPSKQRRAPAPPTVVVVPMPDPLPAAPRPPISCLTMRLEGGMLATDCD
jgi:hypothetical protein